PGAQGGEGRLEADGAGDAVEDDVAAGTGELGGGVGADADVDVGHGPAALGGDGGDGGAHVVGVPAGDADERDVVVEDLLGEEAEVPAARPERDDVVAGGHLQRLGPDGPGAAEERERGHSTARRTSTARSR